MAAAAVSAAVPACQQLVSFVRQPRFRFSATDEAAVLSRYDPYAVLCLVAEDSESLLSMLRAKADDADAATKLRQRAARIREAYLDLAAVFHPDASCVGGSDVHRRSQYTWMSAYEHFAAIAGAYKLLMDEVSTLEYFLALTPEVAIAKASDDLVDLCSLGKSEMFENISRELRRQHALREREGMMEHVRAVRDLHVSRHLKHGDGFFVVWAVYGDARGVDVLSKAVAGGKPVDAVATQAQLPNSVLLVTDVLQGMVEVTERDSASESSIVQLVLPGGSKTKLDGIWDPCDGNHKALFLRYEFLGRCHEALIDDAAPLKCPVRRHVVPGAQAVVSDAIVAAAAAEKKRAEEAAAAAAAALTAATPSARRRVHMVSPIPGSRRKAAGDRSQQTALRVSFGIADNASRQSLGSSAENAPATTPLMQKKAGVTRRTPGVGAATSSMADDMLVEAENFFTPCSEASLFMSPPALGTVFHSPTTTGCAHAVAASHHGAALPRRLDLEDASIIEDDDSLAPLDLGAATMADASMRSQLSRLSQALHDLARLSTSGADAVVGGGQRALGLSHSAGGLHSSAHVTASGAPAAHANVPAAVPPASPGEGAVTYTKVYDPATGRALIVQTASRATKRSMAGASSALQACGGQRGLRSRMRAAAAAAGAGVASKGMQHDASMLPTAPTGAATQPPAGAILAVQAKLSAMSACAEAPRALSVRWFSPRATVLYLTGATAAALASWMLYRWLSGRSATALGSRDAVRATVLLLTDSSDDAAAATTAVATASADVRSVLDGIQNVAHGAARWLRTTLQRGVVAPYPPAVVPSASWRASELA